MCFSESQCKEFGSSGGHRKLITSLTVPEKCHSYIVVSARNVIMQYL